MKIGHPPPQSDSALNRTGSEAAKAAAVPAKTAPVAGAAAKSTGAAAGATTQVKLSHAAETLRAQAATPEFDGPKVERVKKAIDNGTYVVNPDVIADKLISNAQEVLSAVKR